MIITCYFNDSVYPLYFSLLAVYSCLILFRKLRKLFILCINASGALKHFPVFISASSQPGWTSPTKERNHGPARREEGDFSTSFCTITNVASSFSLRGGKHILSKTWDTGVFRKCFGVYKKIRIVQHWQVLEQVDFVPRWEAFVVQSPVFQLAVDLPLVLSSLLLVQWRRLILSHY